MQGCLTEYSANWRRTKTGTFAESLDRAKQLRRSPLWKLIQLNLPKIPFSGYYPNYFNICAADLEERLYLTVPDDQWVGLLASASRDSSEVGPVVTGDAQIDKLERELWERMKAQDG